FSFSTGRREAAGGHHLDRRASKLIQIMPAIKSAQPSTAQTKSREGPGLFGKPQPMLANKWRPSATWGNTMTARETNPNNNEEHPTIIGPNPPQPRASPLAHSGS